MKLLFLMGSSGKSRGPPSFWKQVWTPLQPPLVAWRPRPLLASLQLRPRGSGGWVPNLWQGQREKMGKSMGNPYSLVEITFFQTPDTPDTPFSMPFSKSFLFPAKPGFKPEASLVHCWRDLRCLHLPATCSGCSADVGKSHMQMRESTSQCTHCRKSLHL